MTETAAPETDTIEAFMAEWEACKERGETFEALLDAPNGAASAPGIVTVDDTFFDCFTLSVQNGFLFAMSDHTGREFGVEW